MECVKSVDVREMKLKGKLMKILFKRESCPFNCLTYMSENHKFFFKFVYLDQVGQRLSRQLRIANCKQRLNICLKDKEVS